MAFDLLPNGVRLGAGPRAFDIEPNKGRLQSRVRVYKEELVARVQAVGSVEEEGDKKRDGKVDYEDAHVASAQRHPILKLSR